MELAKTLSLFEGSDLIFVSYGEEKEGKYFPHSRAIRLVPDPALLEKAVESTSPLPNDFGIMPFKWKARSEEDKTEILLRHKLERWTEGELFAYGYLIIDRLLLDIDTGEISRETAIKLAKKLRSRGIGKVAYTGGGLLAVLELDRAIRVTSRQTFAKLRSILIKKVKEMVQEVDTGSFSVGKGVRLVGTFSRKRGVNTEWILWEEGEKFDLCTLAFGIGRERLSRAPAELKRKLEESFGIELEGVEEKVSPEEIFAMAGKFYGELDGRRNEFMLQLAGEMLRAGVEKEKVVELYLEHLADLEKKDRPYWRIRQTVDYVYREGKRYLLTGDYPEDFLKLVRAFRGEKTEEDWQEWAKKTGSEKLFFLLDLLGELISSESGSFHPGSAVYRGDLTCICEEQEEKRKRTLNCTVYMKLPPCVRGALEEYISTQNGDTTWILKNLLQISFLLPEDTFEIEVGERVVSLEDNPLVRTIKLLSRKKGISPGEIRESVVKKAILKESSGINLIRCVNPLLKKHCSERCPHYRFRSSLPHIVKRTKDLKTRRILYVRMRVDGKEIEVEGEFLNSLKQFSTFLEREGIILSPIVREWLYEDLLRNSEQEYVDEERERVFQELVELLLRNPHRWIRKVDGRNIWMTTSAFMEFLSGMGYRAGRRNVGRIRERFGFSATRTRSERFTLIPYTFFGDLVQDIILSFLEVLRYILIPEGIEVQVEEEMDSHHTEDRLYLEGKKLYVCPCGEGFKVSFMGKEMVFRDLDGVRMWIEEVRTKEEEVELEL